MSMTQQFASFTVGDLLLGVEVERVREVTATIDITRVPLAPPAIRGVLNLRGQIVTAIDLRCCLQLDEVAPEQELVNLILETEYGCTSLLVDEVGEVLEIEDDKFEAAPATLRGGLRELIRGAYMLDEQLLLVLDTDRVLGGIGEASW